MPQKTYLSNRVESQIGVETMSRTTRKQKTEKQESLRHRIRKLNRARQFQIANGVNVQCSDCKQWAYVDDVIASDQGFLYCRNCA
jgi:predicted amidophosphoribosyltransferase